MFKNLTVIGSKTSRSIENHVFAKLILKRVVLFLHHSKLVLILPVITVIIELHISINTKTRNITGVFNSDILETAGSKRRAEQL